LIILADTHEIQSFQLRNFEVIGRIWLLNKSNQVVV